jgi:hypothetical protein
MTYDREELRLKMYLAALTGYCANPQSAREASGFIAARAGDQANAAVNAFLDDAPTVDHNAPESERQVDYPRHLAPEGTVVAAGEPEEDFYESLMKTG